jgi:hypothetical protein
MPLIVITVFEELSLDHGPVADGIDARFNPR